MVLEGTENQSGAENGSEENQSATGEENNASVADEQGSGDEFESEVKKRGAKNVILENKRKSEELKEYKERMRKIEEENATLKATATKITHGEEPLYLKELREELRNSGMPDTAIEKQIRAMKLMSEEAADKRSAPMERDVYENRLDSELKKLSSEPRYKFVMSKLGDKLKDKIKSDFAPSYWGNSRAIKAMLGELLLDEPDMMSGSIDEPKKKPTIPTETSASSTSTNSSGGISESELEEYALKNGLSTDTKEAKARVRQILTMRKKALESIKK